VVSDRGLLNLEGSMACQKVSIHSKTKLAIVIVVMRFLVKVSRFPGHLLLVSGPFPIGLGQIQYRGLRFVSLFRTSCGVDKESPPQSLSTVPSTEINLVK
jgi:hypothetical protein